MNIEQFAGQLLDQCAELHQLRSRCAYLEQELAKYDHHLRQSNEEYARFFGSLVVRTAEGEFKWPA